MALTRARSARLKRRNLPTTAGSQALVRDYIARTGLTMQAFCHRIGYSAVTLHYWFNNQYEPRFQRRSPAHRSHHRLHGAHPVSRRRRYFRRLHETENSRRLREDFYLALDRARIVVRHGNPGTQKSFVLKYLIAELNRMDAAKNGHGRRAHRIYCREGIKPMQLMRRVAQACGVPSGTNVDSTIMNLRHDFAGRRALLVSTKRST
jgi:hypothetical protein